MGDRQAGFGNFFFSPITKLSSPALVTPTRLPQEKEEVIKKEPEMLPRVQRPEGSSGPL